MEIIYLDKVDSTQQYLINNLKIDRCVWSENQVKGRGSRGNSWIGEKGNLFFSFAISKNSLPKDLKLQSISIYFMYQLKIVLSQLGSKVIFKWPNDLYLKKKVGGIISNIKDDIIIIGIGLNSKYSKNYQKIDIEIDNKELLLLYLNEIQKQISWKTIFEIYEKEFYLNSFRLSNEIDLSKAILKDDGSLELNNERIYSLR